MRTVAKARLWSFHMYDIWAESAMGVGGQLAAFVSRRLFNRRKAYGLCSLGTAWNLL